MIRPTVHPHVHWADPLHFSCIQTDAPVPNNWFLSPPEKNSSTHLLDLGHLPQNISLQLIYDEMDQCLQVHICEKKIPLVLVGAIHHDKESTLSKKCWSFKLAGEKLWRPHQLTNRKALLVLMPQSLPPNTAVCLTNSKTFSGCLLRWTFPCFGTTRSRSVRQASQCDADHLGPGSWWRSSTPQENCRLPTSQVSVPENVRIVLWASYQQHDKSIVALPLEKIFHIGKPPISDLMFRLLFWVQCAHWWPTEWNPPYDRDAIVRRHASWWATPPCLPMTRLMLTFLCHNQSFTWWLVPSSIYSSCSICFSKAHPWPCNNFLRYLSCILTQSLHCVSKFAPNYCYVLATRGVKKAPLFEVLNVHFLRPYFLTDVPLQPSLRLSSVLSLHAGGRIVSDCISLKRKAETSPWCRPHPSPSNTYNIIDW